MTFVVLWGGAYCVKNIIDIWDLSFLDCCTVWFTEVQEDCPRKAENKLQRYSTSSSENGRLCRIHIIMCSVIWFELSDRRATPPNVVKEVTQNARSSPLRIWAWDQALHCKLEPIVAPPSQSSRAWGTPGATRAIVPARGVVLVFTAWMERGEGAGTSLFLTEPLNTT